MGVRLACVVVCLGLATLPACSGGGSAGGGFVTGSGGEEGSACTSAFTGEGCLFAVIGTASIGRRMQCKNDAWVLIETCAGETQCVEKVNAATPGKLVTVCEAKAADAGAAVDASQTEDSDTAGPDALDAPTNDAADAGPVCGDGFCAANAGEDHAGCPVDCPKSGPTCGDGTCEPPETEATCASDCAASTGPVCGDGVCAADDTENLLVCGADCGQSVDFPCLLQDCEAAWDACEASADCSAAFSCVGTKDSDAAKQACLVDLGAADRAQLNALAACLHANGCVD